MELKTLVFNSDQITFLNDMLSTAKQYADKGNDLAIADVKAIQLALDGTTSKQFEYMLEENMSDIENHPLFSLNSQEQYGMLESILKKAKE